MASAPVPTDPWDPSGLPFSRMWPIYAGIVVGFVLAAFLLGADRTDITFTPALVIIGGFAGAVGAALAPAGRRSTRFLDIAYPALVAGVACRLFTAVGEAVMGRDEGGDSVDTAIVYFFVMAFFVGFPLLIAKVFQSPDRRLPDAVLAQIDEPYPTRREPRLVTVRTEDGSTHRISVLRGGFIAGLKLPFDIDTVTGVVSGDVTPSGPRGGRSGRPAGRRPTSSKPIAPRAGAKAKDAKATTDTKASKASKWGKGASVDTDAEPAPRVAPAPTSRTTAKGTPDPKRRPKR